MNIDSKTDQLHNQFGFWTILACTIFIPLGTALYIGSELNLVFSPDNLESYKRLKEIFSVPVYLLSVSMAVLAFYALWFRTIQTNQQINLTLKQLEHQQETRDSDSLKHLEQIENQLNTHKINSIKSQINDTSDFLLKITREVESTPSEMIKIIRDLDKNIERHRYDHANKLVKLHYDKDNENENENDLTVPWSNPIINLKFIINSIGKKETITMYKEDEITSASNHKTIASQLVVLVVLCKELAEIDRTSHKIIRIKLSIFNDVLHILKSVDLIEDHMYELYYILQSLAHSDKSLHINLLEMFALELNEDGMIAETITDKDLSMLPTVKNKDKSIQYSVSYGDKIFERILGYWSDITPNN